MTKSNMARTLVAILAALTFTAGGLILLMQDAIKTHVFGVPHALTIITVLGTIFVGYLAEVAIKELKVISFLAWSLLFVLGTTLVVYNSIGRQAEAYATSALSAEDRNQQRAAAKVQIAEHQRMLNEEQAERAREAANGGCGKKCQGIDTSIAVYQSAVAGDEATLRSLGPIEPVAAQAEQLADILALFGANKAQVKALATVMTPLLWALFFEIGSVVSWGFVPRVVHRKVRVATVSDPVVITPRLDTQSQAVINALAKGPCKSNDELAARMKVSKSEASRRVKAMNGQIMKRRVGKEVQISLTRH